MVWIAAIDQCHIVYVVVFHGIDKTLNQFLVKFKSLEQSCWILLWHLLVVCGFIDRVACVLD